MDAAFILLQNNSCGRGSSTNMKDMGAEASRCPSEEAVARRSSSPYSPTPCPPTLAMHAQPSLLSQLKRVTIISAF